MPEMLPMVITACLAKGSLAMGKKQTIIKDLNAMQSFGSMDVLCMDKTGTLTNEVSCWNIIWIFWAMKIQRFWIWLI